MPNNRYRKSTALRDFYDSVRLADTLIKRESRFADPPPIRTRKVVQGLRGGAAVLMVAAFENFLKEMVDERLQRFTLHPLQYNPQTMPEDMVYHNFVSMLEKALKGPFTNNETKTDKIANFRRCATFISQDLVVSTNFGDLVRSNPNSKKLRALFKACGCADIFASIKGDFDIEWGMPTARTFIENTLDAILDRRHEVAHTAIVLNVSRRDLQESIKFLKVLAYLCDRKLHDILILIS